MTVFVYPYLSRKGSFTKTKKIKNKNSAMTSKAQERRLQCVGQGRGMFSNTNIDIWQYFP